MLDEANVRNIVNSLFLFVFPLNTVPVLVLRSAGDRPPRRLRMLIRAFPFSESHDMIAAGWVHETAGRSVGFHELSVQRAIQVHHKKYKMLPVLLSELHYYISMSAGIPYRHSSYKS